MSKNNYFDISVMGGDLGLIDHIRYKIWSREDRIEKTWIDYNKMQGIEDKYV